MDEHVADHNLDREKMEYVLLAHFRKMLKIHHYFEDYFDRKAGEHLRFVILLELFGVRESMMRVLVENNTL